MKRLFNVKCVMLNVFILYTLHFTHYTGVAQTLPSTELITRAQKYDGKIVTFAGEVVGDIMGRGQYVWININDGLNAIGVWVNRDLLNVRLITGGYKSRGSWIEAQGVFSRTCPEHGGDLDIHAQAVTLISDGYATPEKAAMWNSGSALGSLILLASVWLLSLFWTPGKGRRHNKRYDV